jgi:hypothetical protein
MNAWFGSLISNVIISKEDLGNVRPMDYMSSNAS